MGYRELYTAANMADEEYNISDKGLEIFTPDYEKTDKISEAQGILVRSAAMHDMEFSPELLAIARAGAGVNNIPLDKCAEKGIVVFNTPGANANSVKELTIAGLLLAARDIIGACRNADRLKRYRGGRRLGPRELEQRGHRQDR